MEFSENITEFSENIMEFSENITENTENITENTEKLRNLGDLAAEGCCVPGSAFPSDGGSCQGFPFRRSTIEVCLGGSWGEPLPAAPSALAGRDQPLITPSCLSPLEAGALCWGTAWHSLTPLISYFQR